MRTRHGRHRSVGRTALSIQKPADIAQTVRAAFARSESIFMTTLSEAVCTGLAELHDPLRLLIARLSGDLVKERVHSRSESVRRPFCLKADGD